MTQALFDQFEHFHKTLDFLIERDQLETAARLAESLGTAWEIHDCLEDGLDYLSLILNAPDADALSPELRASLHTISGSLTRHQSRYSEARSCYAAASALAPGSLTTNTSILSGLGEIAFRQGDYLAAANYYGQHFNISHWAGDVQRIADAVNGLGRVAAVQNGLAEALDYHQFGQTLCEQSGYRQGMGWSLNAVGEIERAGGNYLGAAAYFRRSATLFDSEANPGAAALARQNLAFVLLSTGDAAAARLLFEDVICFWMRGRSAHGIALCLIGLASVFELEKRFVDAARCLIFADIQLATAGIQLEMGDRIDYERAVTRLHESLSDDAHANIKDSVRGLTIQVLWSQIAAAQDLPIAPHLIPRLTPREVELLRLIELGLTDKQIAARLVISRHTVNAHLRTIYRKLGVSNRTAAIHAAAEYLI